MMNLNVNTEGILIFSAIATYLFAFVTYMLKAIRAGRILHFMAFMITLVAFVQHTVEVKQVPLQSMYEVFLLMGTLAYPVSLFCRKFLKTGFEQADMFITAVILFPCGYIFSHSSQDLPPALQSVFFVPHVGVYLLGYFVMAKAAVHAVCRLVKRKTAASLEQETMEFKLVRLGVPFLTLGFVLGSIWAYYAWKRFWGWDPKEIWSLATLLVYAIYFLFRNLNGQKYSRVNSLLVVVGFVFILITLLYVNLGGSVDSKHNYLTSVFFLSQY